MSNYSESKHTNHVLPNYVFSVFFQDIHSYGEVSGEKGFGFETVKEIVISERVEVVINALKNNEVIDVGNVAEAYQVYI